jgi:hypothetical protein
MPSAELAICALLAKLGALAANFPATRKYLNTVERTWLGFKIGALWAGRSGQENGSALKNEETLPAPTWC